MERFSFGKQRRGFVKIKDIINSIHFLIAAEDDRCRVHKKVRNNVQIFGRMLGST